MKSLIASLLLCALSIHVSAASPKADPATLKAHVEFLADDLLEGRETGTRGHDIAARYVASQFAQAGLQPRGDARTFFQRVPFRSTHLLPNASELELVGPGDPERYKLGEDFFVAPSRHVESSHATAEVVYAGHGIAAPHLGVDDYAELDVKGKFVMVLAGVPAFLGGDEGAHFANARLKQEAAAERGAIGLITLQTPVNEMLVPFAQGLINVQFRTAAWLDETGKPHGGGTAVPYLATFSLAGAEKLVGRGGASMAGLISRANERLPPQRVDIGAKVRIASRTRLREVSSPNVVGVVEGGDPALKDEYVVMTAHLDHLGMVEGKSGDNIYNGALDNATGVAVIAEAARVIAAMPSRPKRSILFVAMTGEEAGMLGSEYLVSRLQAANVAMVANVNIDMPIVTYDFHDICAVGADNSSIGELIAKVARSRGVPTSPDPHPERRRFTRSDQYSFVKAGIPAAFLLTGVDSMTEKGAGRAARNEIEQRHYHRVSDDSSLPINYAAAARFADLSAAIVLELANSPTRPRWKAGNFFGDTFGKLEARNTAAK